MKKACWVACVAMMSAASAWGADEISVTPLENVSADTIGTLNVTQGGLPMDLWKGVQRDEAEQFIAALPVGVDSSVLSSLIVRTVSSVVQPPEGKGKYKTLIPLRLDVLYAQAPFETFDAFYHTIPNNHLTETMQLHYTVRALYHNPEYCKTVAADVAVHQDYRLQLAKAFCQAVAGEGDKALLTLSLLQESYPALPYHASQLLRKIASTEKKPSFSVLLPTPLSPLELLMAIQAGEALPEGLELKGYPAFMLEVIATYDKTPKVLRIKAAEMAFRRGAATAETLASVYNAMPFPEEMLAKAGVDSIDLPPTLLRALYFQLYQKTQGTEEAEKEKRYHVLHVVLEQFRADGLLDVAYGLLHQEKILQLPEQSDSTVLAFAADAAKMALYPRNTVSVSIAEKWLKLAEGQTLRSTQDAESVAYLSFLTEIAQLTDDPEDEANNVLPWQRIYDDTEKPLTAWWQTHQERITHDIKNPALLSSMMIMTNALGYDVPSSIQHHYDALLAKKHPVKVYAVANMQEPLFFDMPEENFSAARSVFHIMKAFEYASLEKTSPVVLAAAITQLREVGLYDDAKQLALEYLVLYR